MKIAAVIMAGGRGERFWPESRSNCPKQFLSLTDDGETLIQKTVGRLESFIDAEDIYIAANINYRELVKAQLPQIPEENILLEPAARNTAPCIGLAAAVIKKKYGEAVMAVLPSDHLIKFNQMFTDTLRTAVSIAEKGNSLVTIGIAPTYPETGYGYIRFKADGNGAHGIYRVCGFVEKPNIGLAKEYVNSGEYLWNSGMFVWKVSSIEANLEKYLPEMTEGLERIYEAAGTEAFSDTVAAEFPKFPSVSIDFGVMEKADDVYTVPGNFGWDDVGNWLALERINRTDEHGNMIKGDVIAIETKNTSVCGGGKLIALVGIENLVVVDTEDALLICDKDSTGDVKKVIESLKLCGRNDLY